MKSVVLAVLLAIALAFVLDRYVMPREQPAGLDASAAVDDARAVDGASRAARRQHDSTARTQTATGALAADDRTQLRKCIASDGHVSFQDEPCPTGAREAWTRAIDDDARPPSSGTSDALRDAATLAQIARSGTTRRLSPEMPTRSAEEIRCDAAVAHAERVRDERWSSLKHDDLRELDEYVRRNCVGVDR